MAQKYGWFSPVKGAYLGMGQEDKTAPVVGTDETAVCRGTVLKFEGDKFSVATTFAAGDDLYFCLQDYTDTQAEFAGNAWYATSPRFQSTATMQSGAPLPKVLAATATAGGVSTQGPAVTGISIYQSGEYQTSVFKLDQSTTVASYDIGTKLTVVAGELAPISNDDDPFFAIVTAAPFDRYLNDKPMDFVRQNQGAMGKVLQFRTI